MANYGTALREIGEMKEASFNHRLAFELLCETKGEADHVALNIGGSYALTLSLEGRHKDAVQLAERLLRLKLCKLGSKHKDTIYSMKDLSKYLKKLGRTADVEKLDAFIEAVNT